MRDAPHGSLIQPDDAIVPEEPVVAVEDAGDLPTDPLGRTDHGPNHRVQSGGVPAAGIHGDASNFGAHGPLVSTEMGARPEGRTPMLARQLTYGIVRTTPVRCP